MKKLHYNFQNVDTVQGTCPHCEEETILVSIVTEFYRCVNCGADLEQKVNGVIKYIEANPNTKIKLMEEFPPDHG